MKCLVCGCTELTSGEITTHIFTSDDDYHEKVGYLDSGGEFKDETYPIRAKRCKACGFVMLFALKYR